MGGVLVACVGLALLIAFVVVQGRFSKTKNFVQEVREYLLYNFVIRVFQTTFLIFNYYSFVATRVSQGTFEKVVSIAMLVLQFGAVIFFGVVYTQVSADNLK